MKILNSIIKKSSKDNKKLKKTNKNIKNSIQNKKSKKKINRYYNKCFINKPHQVIPFTPETDNKYLTYNEFSYKAKYIFPIKKKIKSIEDFKKLKMSKIGLYSIAYINLGKKIFSIIKKKMKNTNKLILTEANGGVGGLSLHLIDYFKISNIIEVNKFHLDIIQHNLNEYGFNKSKYKLYNGDSHELIFKLKSDIIIFDPPWFGHNYKDNYTLSLGLNNVQLACIINKLIKLRKCRLILFLIPENFNFEIFLDLIDLKGFKIEINQVLIKKNKKQSIITICK